MDALDRLAEPAEELLAKVDDALARFGAPNDHPVWPLLRQLRALPGDAVRAVAGLHPAPAAEAVPLLVALAAQYAQASLALPGGRPPDWRGPAAEAFAGHWTVLCDHVEHGLAERLTDTAAFAIAAGAWASQTRLAVASTLAAVLGSAEAVTVGCGADPAQLAHAAAEIAARVLSTVAEAYAEADRLLSTCSGRLGELPFTPAPAPTSSAPQIGSIDIPL